VHQPSGGSQGSASDISIAAKQIMKTKKRINKLISDETGRAFEQVEKDTDRDYWMSVDEAIEYGIVTQVVKSVTEIS
jgi:ATP-dependent Clp protease protease subunit